MIPRLTSVYKCSLAEHGEVILCDCCRDDEKRVSGISSRLAKCCVLAEVGQDASFRQLLCFTLAKPLSTPLAKRRTYLPT